jgi:methionyl aminopeptidase
MIRTYIMGQISYPMDYLQCYQKAGHIASEVRETARATNHVGRTLLEICDSLENQIKKLGGLPAFPVNVSLNDIAAHYTAEPYDETEVKEGDILKIDIGVQIDGYIADTAVTVCYDAKYDPLVKASEVALAEAVKLATANARVYEIGKVIENTISRFGFKPIQNLSGHSLDRYTIHAGKSIPNIRTIGASIGLIENQAYAIEPFVTTKIGHGVVYEGKTRNIFAIRSRKPSKDKKADNILETIWNTYKSLPFAARWLIHQFEETEVIRSINMLVAKKNIHAYPILVETQGQIVAQSEHTIIPKIDHVDIITD